MNRRSVWMYHGPDLLPRIKRVDPQVKVREQTRLNTDERDSKRVKFVESQGQKMYGEDVEELTLRCVPSQT